VEIGLRHDGLSEERGQSAIEEVLAQYLPYPEALYYARNRIGQAFGGRLTPQLEAMIVATWLDAFTKGAEFASKRPS